jgi:hypothetical protein
MHPADNVSTPPDNLQHYPLTLQHYPLTLQHYPLTLTMWILVRRIENLVLQIKSLAGSDMNPRSFGFLDPPSDESLEAAMVKARQAGALSPSEALTPLGSILASLPLDINVGKLLILGSLLGISSPTLTIAAALSVQSPFSRVPEDDERVKSARLELLHAEGDAFTLLKLFDEWVAVKATGRAREEEPQASIPRVSNEGSRWQRGEGGGRMISITSKRWCKRGGVEEQRLYEIAKLRAQYEELMRDAGIVKKLSGSKRGLRGGELYAARSKLRDMQHERDRLRGTRVLSASAKEEEGEEGEEREEREAGTGDSIDDLDMRVHLDLSKVHKEASCPLTQADMQLLKVIIASAFTPRVALPDAKNSQRRSQDCRFSTSSHADLVIHPGSSLRDPTSLRAQDCLFYYELLETRRMYLCGLTPTPALPSLLISSTEVDVDETCSWFIFDGWIMIRLLDDSGPKLLLWSISLRRRIQRLLAARLSLNSKGFHQLPGCSLDQQGDVYLYPWQAAASGCASEIQSQLERMPKDLRLGLVTMAAQNDVLSDATLATARWWGVELDPSPLDINEERLAEELVSFMDLSVSFNTEKLQGGLKTTSHYRLPSSSPATDGRGVPQVKSGIPLTGYVNWGSLLGCDSHFASHKLQPAMRRHWSCPGCEARGILSFEEIQQHLSICSKAKGLDKRQREEGGYGHSADSILKPNESIDKLMSSELAVQWGRRVMSQIEREIEDGEPSVQALPTNASFFRCDVCGIQSLMTPVQQLQHKRACGAHR